jgi:hypothetical protein
VHKNLRAKEKNYRGNWDFFRFFFGGMLILGVKMEVGAAGGGGKTKDEGRWTKGIIKYKVSLRWVD